MNLPAILFADPDHFVGINLVFEAMGRGPGSLSRPAS